PVLYWGWFVLTYIPQQLKFTLSLLYFADFLLQVEKFRKRLKGEMCYIFPTLFLDQLCIELYAFVDMLFKQLQIITFSLHVVVLKTFFQPIQQYIYILLGKLQIFTLTQFHSSRLGLCIVRFHAET